MCFANFRHASFLLHFAASLYLHIDLGEVKVCANELINMMRCIISAYKPPGNRIKSSISQCYRLARLYMLLCTMHLGLLKDIYS